MAAVMDVTARNGVPFRVLYLPAGAVGPFPAAKDDASALVEFYDRRYPFTEHGQFTGGRYHASTLLGLDGYGSRIGSSSGLDLAGGVDAWTLDRDTAALVAAWIEAQS